MSKPLTPEKWQQIQEVFLQAVELSPIERDRLLNKFDSETLRRTVAQLVEADEQERGFLETSPIKFVESNSGESETPERIGRYRIVREIGRGGMGAVYLAARETDFGKQVAVKVIKRGMDSDEILRRFRHERQILARLEHPHIARLLDGGTTDQGAPFLVMEYVEGADLINYSTEKNLSLADRLALFRKICSAVAYAHQNLIVHRDLKPSNIIVTESGEPKLLDFGISKLLAPDGGANDTGTATALGMMTPAYASPEQFRGEAVTTATDVYSLGVILFELLTGHLPYDVKNRRFDEAARIVNETAPTAPSRVVSDFNSPANDAKKTNSQAAGTKDDDRADSKFKPKSRIQNPRLLRGDLDNIVLKALRKEPERRYSSIELFSEDIRRHLAGLPVAARADTFGYRAAKFVNRNRFSVASAALVALALVAGIAGTTWQAVRAEHERALAQKRFGEVRALANNILFKYYDEVAQLPNSTKLREMFAKDSLAYLDRLTLDATGDDELKREIAAAYTRVGNVQGSAYQQNLGDTVAAVESHRKAVALLEAVNEKSAGVEVKKQLCEAYQYLSDALRKTNGKTAAFAEKSRALNEQMFAATPGDARTGAALADSLIYLADVKFDESETAAKTELYQRAFKLIEAAIKAEPDNQAILKKSVVVGGRLGNIYLELAEVAKKSDSGGRARDYYQLAEPYFAGSRRHAEQLYQLNPGNPINHRNALAARNNYAILMGELGRADEALQMHRAIVEEWQAVVDADRANAEARYDLNDFLVEYANDFSKKADYENALTNLRKAAAASDALVAEDAENLEYWQQRLMINQTLGKILLEKGDYELAAETYLAAFAQYKKAPFGNEDSFDLAYNEGLMHEQIGNVYAAQAENQTAQTQIREKLRQACRSFEQTLAIWNQPEVLETVFADNSVELNAIQQKLERYQAKLAQ